MIAFEPNENIEGIGMNGDQNKDTPRKQETPGSEEYVITPWLMVEVLKFQVHYKVAKGEPIIILGPTGVGKSLFLVMAEKLFKEEKPDGKVVKANCAHFGGQYSDPNVALSHLFGSKRGAVTGIVERKGLVEEAKGGLLILEEIGELPHQVQAMLLTFIEDHEYRKFGGKEILQSECQIVGATNNEEGLRDDFKNRFFPFVIRPLYERRYDVLYYLGLKFPELVTHLRSFEVLALLAYNWPGNVREVERIGRILDRERKLMEDYKAPQKHPKYSSDFFYFDPRDTALNVSQVKVLSERLYKLNKNTYVLLRKILKKHGMALDVGHQSFPFQNFQLNEIIYSQDNPKDMNKLVEIWYKSGFMNYDPMEIIKKFGLRILKKYNKFDKAWKGLLHYCNYFFQFPDENKDLLDASTGSPRAFRHKKGPHGPTKAVAESVLEKQVFEMLADIDIAEESRNIPNSGTERTEFFISLHKKHPSNKFLKSLIDEKSLPSEAAAPPASITSMSWDAVQKHYLTQLLSETNGNKREAARRADVNPSTFYSMYDKHFPKT